MCRKDEVEVDGKCEKCSELLTGCKTCSSKDECTTCSDEAAQVVGGQCVCPNGENVDGSCKKVSTSSCLDD